MATIPVDSLVGAAPSRSQNGAHRVETLRYTVVVEAHDPLGKWIMDALFDPHSRLCPVRVSRSSRIPARAHLVVVDEDVPDFRRHELVLACGAPIFTVGRDASRPRDPEQFRRVLLELARTIPVSGELVAVDPASMMAEHMVKHVAPRSSPVLLRGEVGTGKATLARRIHELSGRKGPLVITSGREGIDGPAARAHNGTLFIEEVGDLIDADAQRLGALCPSPLGGKPGEPPPPVRIVASTTRNLRAESPPRGLRDSVYFRLAVFVVHVAPLRERPRDLRVLVERLHARHDRAQLVQFSYEARELLLHYKWPNNIHELENVMGRVLSLAPAGEVSVPTLVALAPELARAARRWYRAP